MTQSGDIAAAGAGGSGQAAPALTLPPLEAAALRDAYAAASTVLEYGSGGSTLMAAELCEKAWSVESDGAWAQMMQRHLDQHPSGKRVTLFHADIGPTREWGHPATNEGFRSWPDYPLKVWDLPVFLHPDVILVDGRFRLACFLTALYRIERPVTLFFDDYVPRPAYHKAEALVKPTKIIGRMARFDLTPTPLSPDRLRDYTRALLQPV